MGLAQVIDLVVDVTLWPNVFLQQKPEINDIVQIGQFCRDINMPQNLPDNCETEVPFLVMNVTSEGHEGYAYLQHASIYDYSKQLGKVSLLIFASQCTLSKSCHTTLTQIHSSFRHQQRGWFAER